MIIDKKTVEHYKQIALDRGDEIERLRSLNAELVKALEYTRAVLMGYKGHEALLFHIESALERAKQS